MMTDTVIPSSAPSGMLPSGLTCMSLWNRPELAFVTVASEIQYTVYSKSSLTLQHTSASVYWCVLSLPSGLLNLVGQGSRLILSSLAGSRRLHRYRLLSLSRADDSAHSIHNIHCIHHRSHPLPEPHRPPTDSPQPRSLTAREHPYTGLHVRLPGFARRKTLTQQGSPVRQVGTLPERAISITLANVLFGLAKTWYKSAHLGQTTLYPL